MKVYQEFRQLKPLGDLDDVKVKLESTEDASVADLRRSSPAMARLLRGFRGERIDLPLFEVELKLAPIGR